MPPGKRDVHDVPTEEERSAENQDSHAIGSPAEGDTPLSSRRGKLTVRKEYLIGLMVMRVKAVLVLWLLCLSVPCSGQVKVPDTPAGQKFAAWLEVFNRGDREAYKAFLEENYPSEAQHADQAMAFREMTGGFDLKK
ncbi:MAG TPA: hypothetical protein VF992_00405, partial [Thermoplasmata archaeon]